jgi:5-oxoprolinase (ATP-hydrolysing)
MPSRFEPPRPPANLHRLRRWKHRLPQTILTIVAALQKSKHYRCGDPLIGDPLDPTRAVSGQRVAGEQPKNDDWHLNAPWDIWIDTGGTFTDCLARDPTGTLHRVKVLSTSALRGAVRRQIDERSLEIEQFWRGPGGLVRGFTYRSLADPAVRALVDDFAPVEGVLRLDRPIPRGLPGTAFELASPEEAPILAARIATGTAADEPLPPVRMRLATTRATNALLERKGSRLAFFVTRGFADLLRIGTQQRPDLFSLHIERPLPLHATVVEVTERLASDGTVIEPIDVEAVLPDVRSLLEDGVTVAAVSFLHAYRNTVHERRMEELLVEAGFHHVSRSSRLAPAINYLHRSETAVTNAYLDHVLTGYLRQVERSLASRSGDGPGFLHLMTSAGGLVRSAEFDPKDSLLSGPAGGVVGAAGVGRAVGFDRLIAFDMGGTSTDVSRFDGDFDYVWRHRVGDAQLIAPALAIETVAAGGGSICAWKTDSLAVGPESAGAVPGPACYGAGGPLTLTDCNLLLGRIDPARFGIPLHPQHAELALQALQAEIRDATGEMPDREPLLDGLLAIADERMADAIRTISIRKGYDPAEYALVPFGGAGAQHGCGVARRLGITRQIIPPNGGLLSAYGLGGARIERIAGRQILRPFDPDLEWLRAEVTALEREAAGAVAVEGIDPRDIQIRRRIANLRLAGQETTLELELDEETSIRAAFRRRYREIYGHEPEARPLEVESLRVIASGPDMAAAYRPSLRPRQEDDEPEGRKRHVLVRTRVWVGGGWRSAPCLDRSGLHVDQRLQGPCLVHDDHTSILVEEGWIGSVHRSGAIILTTTTESSPTLFTAYTTAAPRPVQDQLFTSRFESLVEEMGEQLRRTAISTNVKERLDFSCALLDAQGELVANAPHIPVHLGALGLCVRTVAADITLRPGDVVATNHPAFGGSHLPDITTITPVHTDGGDLVGYVANRAHHAEIGGSRPGSMPPDARTLAEEGVVIAPVHLVRGGQANWPAVEAMFSAAPYPSRSVGDNIADLRAQVAANHRGAEQLRALVRKHGAEIVREQMEALTSRSEIGTRRALERIGDGVRTATETLDDGSRITVRITISEGGAEFDFTGTSGVHPGNLNATPAVVRSAILYVVRLLIDEPLPLNEGLLRPIRTLLPRSLLDPDFGGPAESVPAVVGGNTEISQRLVDTLLKALSLAACSQGTMNNVLWGNDRFGYYETIAGGAGAISGHPGCSGVHTHMTNTRVTDPEVLELRYPVRVNRFGFRTGSGGSGEYPGGDGVVREITFLEPLFLSVLTQHRREGPYGFAGGGPGEPGRQIIIRANGERIELDSIDGRQVGRGDRFIIETPGGGGWGRANA